MPKESKGLNGKIQISYSWRESSSGHHETWNEESLICGKDNSIIFKEEVGELGMYKNMSNYRKVKTYKININKLKKLIKENADEVNDVNLPPIGDLNI